MEKVGTYYMKIIDNHGNTIEEHSYDAWGNHRNPSNWTLSNFSSNLGINRGFTGHEMLPTFQLINMNGRMYDPVIGRMLSPDNFVQNPDNAQSYNRYSYVLNNPLKFTDPSGWLVDDYFVNAKTGIVKSIIKTDLQDRVFLESRGVIKEITNNEGKWDLKGINIGHKLIDFVSQENVNWMMENSGVNNFYGTNLDAIFKLLTGSHAELDFANYYLMPENVTVETADSYKYYFLFEGFGQNTAYNIMDAGNFLWGQSAYRLGAWEHQIKLGSQINAKIYDGIWDTKEDQKAIINGFNYRVNTNKVYMPSFIIEPPRPRR